jgi:hypothetical protein
MRHSGWHKRPGVHILEGRWQDILCDTQYTPRSHEGLADEPFDIGKFDIVYFDTFMEGYRGHMEFIKHVPRLLRGSGSRFSFFNGHGQKLEELYKVRLMDCIVCGDPIINVMIKVYLEVERLHHNDVGLNTEWFGASIRVFVSIAFSFLLLTIQRAMPISLPCGSICRIVKRSWTIHTPSTSYPSVPWHRLSRARWFPTLGGTVCLRPSVRTTEGVNQ